MQVENIEVAGRSQPLQLFSARFSEHESEIETYQSFLSTQELTVAQKKVSHTLRNQTTLSFGFRRQILADILKVNPAELNFTFISNQKPILAGASLQFNVSHSNDFWVMCVDPVHQVGVDIESKKRTLEFLALAKRFFHPDEIKYIEESPDMFWRFWTAKEAILKASGEGIVYSLDRIHLKIGDNNEIFFPGWELISREVFAGTHTTIAMLRAS